MTRASLDQRSERMLCLSLGAIPLERSPPGRDVGSTSAMRSPAFRPAVITTRPGVVAPSCTSTGWNCPSFSRYTRRLASRSNTACRGTESALWLSSTSLAFTRAPGFISPGSVASNASTNPKYWVGTPLRGRFARVSMLAMAASKTRSVCDSSTTRAGLPTFSPPASASSTNTSASIWPSTGRLAIDLPSQTESPTLTTLPSQSRSNVMTPSSGARSSRLSSPLFARAMLSAAWRCSTAICSILLFDSRASIWRASSA